MDAADSAFPETEKTAADLDVKDFDVAYVALAG